MSNGNVERCATLLITRSESEYHGDVLFLSFSFFFLFFLTRIRFRARERSGRFFGRLGDGLSGREFRERRGNIWWQWSRRSAPGCAADTYICRDLIALPRFVYSHLSGTLSAGCCTTEVFDVSTSIESRALCRLYGRGHATDTGCTPLLHEIVRSLRALLLSTVPNRLSKVTSVSLSNLFFLFHRFELKKILHFFETLFLSFLLSFFLFSFTSWNKIMTSLKKENIGG